MRDLFAIANFLSLCVLCLPFLVSSLYHDVAFSGGLFGTYSCFHYVWTDPKPVLNLFYFHL